MPESNSAREVIKTGVSFMGTHLLSLLMRLSKHNLLFSIKNISAPLFIL
jgi:hypothetical protein